MWQKIGNIFATIGKYALTAAVWAEAHPQAIQAAIAVVQQVEKK